MRDYACQRLDGSVRGDDRYEAIKAFQETEVFVFLLSTRAGGVGLNLTAGIESLSLLTPESGHGHFLRQ